MIARFTLGFTFSADGKYVYLMRKDHPDFQAGKLNGVGGKLEPGETFADCMAREAVEESGYSGAWHHLATMTGNTKGWGMYQCEVFYSVMSEGDTEPHTCEREPIEKHPVADLLSLSSQMVPHLPVLIAAAVSREAAYGWRQPDAAAVARFSGLAPALAESARLRDGDSIATDGDGIDIAALARHDAGPEAGFTLTLPALNWTEETPTSPGWYWNRLNDDVDIVHIYQDESDVMCCQFAEGEILCTLDDVAGAENCEWAGRIPEPCDNAE